MSTRDSSAEEIEARDLLREGWISVSTQHCRVARLTPAAPQDWRELVRPEYHAALDTMVSGSKALGDWFDAWRSSVLRYGATGLVEYRKLSPGVYRAFRRLGGRSA